MKYQKSQTGWIMIVLFTLAIFSLITSYYLHLESNPVSKNGLIIIGSILVLTLLCFYRLKIIIKDKTIHLIYGIGLIHIRLKPKHIKAVEEIKTPFYIGLGIRITSAGMLYNIQGNRAIRITYGDDKGKTIKIGTNETYALKNAILTSFKDEMSTRID